MKTAQGPFPMETTYTWDPAGEGQTRMTLRNCGEPAGFSKIAAPLMASAMRRANQKDLAQLKTLLERRGSLPARVQLAGGTSATGPAVGDSAAMARAPSQVQPEMLSVIQRPYWQPQSRPHQFDD